MGHAISLEGPDNFSERKQVVNFTGVNYFFLPENKVKISSPLTRLPLSFYQRSNVVTIARQLLGKVLVTCMDGYKTSGIIVETEAYRGITDRASHAFGGRRTTRTAVMFGPGGRSYVYFCYGMHHLFNVVTSGENTPHAVLIRALEPLTGMEKMLERRGKAVVDFTLTSGPGSLSKALGIQHRLHSGERLDGDLIWIGDNGGPLPARAICRGTRVGVAYSREDAYLPYRFWIRDNPWVSRGKGLERTMGKKKG